MSEPFLGEIRMLGFNFPPRGWALCDGQILPINQNQSLYSLLGTTYGGDGRSTFALPELRGRTPMHVAGSHPLGQRSGSERHLLTTAQIPSHGHLRGSGDQATTNSPVDGGLASRPRRGAHVYACEGADVVQRGDGATGGSQSHENMQPFLVICFAIALLGLFPSRN